MTVRTPVRVTDVTGRGRADVTGVTGRACDVIHGGIRCSPVLDPIRCSYDIERRRGGEQNEPNDKG
jgi:hypothetical protein